MDHHGESAKPQPLDQWAVTEPWLFGFAAEEFPQSIVREVKLCFRREKEYSTCGHRAHGQTQRERERAASLWQFESLLWGISSKFSLANHVGLPGSESIFDISQDPPL